MTIEECYVKMGANYQDVIKRLPSAKTVSYTHLDVYKRQTIGSYKSSGSKLDSSKIAYYNG